MFPLFVHNHTVDDGLANPPDRSPNRSDPSVPTSERSSWAVTIFSSLGATSRSQKRATESGGGSLLYSRGDPPT
jgi:hypothetical protein